MNSGQPHQRQTRQTHAVEVEPQGFDHEDEEVILIVHSVGVRPTVKPFRAELEISGKKVDMEIDTGAAVSLISHTYNSESPFPGHLLDQTYRDPPYLYSRAYYSCTPDASDC